MRTLRASYAPHETDRIQEAPVSCGRRRKSRPGYPCYHGVRPRRFPEMLAYGQISNVLTLGESRFHSSLSDSFATPLRMSPYAPITWSGTQSLLVAMLQAITMVCETSSEAMTAADSALALSLMSRQCSLPAPLGSTASIAEVSMEPPLSQ